MEINPGGRLDPRHIVGRDREITRFWQILERQGLVISAERRIGKTHIVLKMHETGRDGFITFYQELEGVHGILELVHSVYSAVSGRLSTGAKLKGKLASAWSTLVPKRIGQIDLPQAKDNWKNLLSIAIEDVLTSLPSGHKVVFMWDEFPLMLHNIKRAEGDDIATQLLDQLRMLRQRHGNSLRFLFTGSIGLHLVLRSLRLAGNPNAPINDMYEDTVPPMAETETIELASRLLSRLRQTPNDIPGLSRNIARAVEGFPYYVQHVVDQLDLLDHPATAADVSAAVEALIFADQDPANFAYYVDRIDTYYEAHEKPLAYSALDVIAASDGALSMERLLNLMRHEDPKVEAEHVRSVVRLLRQDHYLEGKKEGDQLTYAFRWSFLKRWWKENRL